VLCLHLCAVAGTGSILTPVSHMRVPDEYLNTQAIDSANSKTLNAATSDTCTTFAYGSCSPNSICNIVAKHMAQLFDDNATPINELHRHA
jgi:hypothetical protein